MIKPIYKTLILFTRNVSLFSIKGLRDIRNFFYRKYYEAPYIYVADNVVIQSAHSNIDACFICKKSLNIGRDCYIDYSGGILFNDKVTISERVCIFTHNHNVHDGYRDWHKNPVVFSGLEVQDYVWIGANSTILASVNFIAEGSVIAAGAVLTKDTEPYGIYAGNPAIRIGTRRINEE